MTSHKQITLESTTSAKLAVYKWLCSSKAKAIIHINHGMAEHAARYDRFANHLNDCGYHVFAHDHRGHGQTIASDTHQGMFAKVDGWEKIIADVNMVQGHIKESYPDLPVFLFGHSMGSIIGLNYCIRHSDTLAGAALWNSGVDGGPLLHILGFLLGIERMLKGSDVTSDLANAVTFKTWNKKFAPNRTEFDWLSKDETEVDKYVNDPLCGFPTCNGLWRDLLIGIRAGASDAELAKIRKSLPMHLLAGGQDPCSDNGKAVERLAARLTQCGIKSVETRIFPENRHEALNEINRDDVMIGFTDWLDAQIVSG